MGNSPPNGALFTVSDPRPSKSNSPATFAKAPKPGQDLRVDMPAIGPDTVAQAAAAGLAGIVIAAGGVLILDRASTCARAETAGLFLLATDAP